jgi:hypothetical protein
MRSMRIDECDDGSFTTESENYAKDNDRYGPNNNRTKETHASVDELKAHVHKHFTGKAAKVAKKSTHKVSNLNERFNKLTHKSK